jgi:ferredoxin hydrogenase large subunit
VCPQDAVEFQYMLQNRWDEVITLDLVHCRVCGEPVYTAAFGETLAEKLRKPEAPVCDRHKPALMLKVKTHYIGRV